MRLISYNIQKGYGGRDHKYDLRRAIEVIEHENPDIICLQEVDHNMKRTQFDDQPRLLADYFGYPGVDYQWNHKIRTGGYGNLILSRYPLQKVCQICLKLVHRKKRGAQMALVDTPEGELLLVGWHLGLKEKQRHNQVRHLLAHDDYCQHAELPTLIVGDFNDWRNTLHKGPFAEYGFKQITTPISRYRTFPAYLPMGALDKAFIKNNVQVQEVRVVKRRLTKDASDHLPLVVDFHLNDVEQS